MTPIIGIDPRDLPGAEHRSAREAFGLVWVTDRVEAVGTWHDGALDVVEATATDKLPLKHPPYVTLRLPVPCAKPPGGWPGYPEDIDPNDPEGMAIRLQDHIDQQPELFAGLWVADTYRVMVVATVGDVESAEAELRAIYPANLCVVRVTHSARDLELVAERLRKHFSEWTVGIETYLNRVWVILPAVDPVTADLLSQDADKIHVVTLLQKIQED